MSAKRKADDTNGSKKNGKSKKSADGDATSNDDGDFTMLTLEDIQAKIVSLCDRVPLIPEGNFGVQKEDNGNIKLNSEIDESMTREWAAQLQAILEEFGLYCSCVSTATYKWNTERTGAAEQNLGLLQGEIAASQDAISSTVTARLTNVLAPVVDLVIERTVTKKQEDSGDGVMEVKTNEFARKLVDPQFLSLCHRILARNAPMLRQVVLSNFKKIVNALKDYLKAQKNDTQHSRGFTY
ncbi:MAG: hypothetical protein SGILL_002837 [Bacillariaceae sp.]